MKKIGIILLVTLALLLAVATALAQTSGTFDLSWNNQPNGGATFSQGGGYTLGATVAQPPASGSMSGGGYSLTGGFWTGPYANYIYGPVVEK